MKNEFLSYFNDSINFIINLKYLIIHKFSELIIKNKNIWVFGAWYGNVYSGNCKYLFEYVNQHHKNIETIWLTRNKNIVKLLRSKGFKVYHFNDIRAFFYCIKAGVAIFNQGRTVDLPRPYLSSKTKYIQLWHGVGPKSMKQKSLLVQRLRNLVYYRNYKNTIFKILLLKIASKLLRLRLNNNLPYEYEFPQDYSLFITKSDLGKKKIKDLNWIPENKIVITGYPTNDVFFTKKINYKIKIIEKILKFKKSDYKIILYAPTFRNEGHRNILIQSLENLKKLEKQLEKNKVKIFIKLHFVDNVLIQKIKINNVYLINIDDVYPVLKHIDILITDYSSIYTDFLLLNRPIIFYDFDRETYATEDRGYYLDYKRYTPGPKAKDWIEIIKIINNNKLLMSYKKDRLKLNNIFNYYKDNKSSERVYYKIIEILN